MRVQGGNAGKAALCWVSAKSEWWLSPAPCELWARVQGQASQSQKWGSRAACRCLLTTCRVPVTPESRDGGGTREVPPGRWGERDGYFPVRRPWGSRLPQCLQQRRPTHVRLGPLAGVPCGTFGPARNVQGVTGPPREALGHGPFITA